MLLKSCSSEARGFTAKVCDFGLSVHKVDADETHVSGLCQVGAP